MDQRSGKPGLPLKSLEEFRVSAELRQQDLHGYFAVQRLVVGLIDGGHASLADLVQQCVASAEGATDQFWASKDRWQRVSICLFAPLAASSGR